MVNDDDNGLSRYDANQVLRDAHNTTDHSVDVTQVNDFVPKAFSKVEIDYISTGNGLGEPGEARYYSNGVAECTRIEVREDEQGDLENSSFHFADLSPAALDGKYLIIHDSGGSVGVYFDVDNSSIIPVTGQTRDIEIDILSTDTTLQIAQKFRDTLHADSEFVASVSGALVLVICNVIGNKTNASDVDTGITITVTDGAGQNSLGGKYFIVYSADNVTQYYVWYDVDNGNVDPAPGGTGIEVDLIAGDTQSSVAIKTRDAIIAATEDFYVTVEGLKFVYIENVKPGITNSTTDGTSEFKFFRRTTGQNKSLVATLFMEYDAQDNLIQVERIDPNEN